MATFALLITLLFQVATPEELKCIGFIHDSLLPMDLYISGTEREGLQTFATESELVYVSGKDLSALKPGDIYWVVRPEGKITNQLTTEPIGIYYKELGTVKIEAVTTETAKAVVLTSCNFMLKGDILLPQANKPPVKFVGQRSTRLTPYPEGGVASSILLGKDDLREMAAGNFCFIGAGARDGVRIGDRFTIYRPNPPFNRRDMLVVGRRTNRTYGKVGDTHYENSLMDILAERKLPPRTMGDLVIVEVAETTAAAKILFSREEIKLGDLVVKR